ncbi:unnamed protein product [Ranitomeya imitator]|uniref:Uncharacterized protein n=1 Tax=Ranitomeya imitator TaxID=111125 RepID=A0ABN9L6R8_9NEOB|nr:unnamed protein product [Ranitomeya imitator]
MLRSRDRYIIISRDRNALLRPERGRSVGNRFAWIRGLRKILLREGCKKILVSDSLALLKKMHRTQSRAMLVDEENICEVCLSPVLPTGDFGIVGRWRAVCVTALQRPNSDAAAIRIVVGIAAASLSVTIPLSLLAWWYSTAGTCSTETACLLATQ